jgi:hypothetical protein
MLENHKDLDRGRMKAYDGSLELSEKDSWLVLKNAKYQQIGYRYLNEGENISLGAKFRFSLHVIRIGNQSKPIVQALSSSDTVDIPLVTDVSVVTSNSVVPPVSGVINAAVSVDNNPLVEKANELSISVYDSISLGLDFSHGMNFAKETRRNFHLDVHPSGDSGHFIMVVSFGRSQFRLSEDNVGLVLESVLGGFCDSFKVSALSERVFSFCVSSKRVGFQILKLRKFVCPKFKCFFHLWGRGGPNWKREFKNWQKECDEEWTLISPSKRRVQLGLSALKKPAPKSIMRPPAGSYRKKLNFAESLCYEACNGYQDAKLPKKTGVLIHDSVAVPSKAIIPFGNFNTDSVVNAATSSSGTRHESVSEELHSDLNDNLDGLKQLVDDMAFQFWECSRCLSMGHKVSACTNDIRCKKCFPYGHIGKSCFNSLAKKDKRWVPRRKVSGVNDKYSVGPNKSLVAPSPDLPDIFSPSTSSSPVPSPPPYHIEGSVDNPSSMANFELDPAPWLPWGHHIIDGGPTRLPQTFYFPSQDPPEQHQQYCVAVIEPAQPLEDEGF